MKEFALKAVELVWKAAWAVVILPFIIPAFAITKLLGGEPLSMDDMGAGFLIMCAIAIGLAVAAGSFAVGYFFF